MYGKIINVVIKIIIKIANSNKNKNIMMKFNKYTPNI
jgi:hypothetical protein